MDQCAGSTGSLVAKASKCRRVSLLEGGAVGGWFSCDTGMGAILGNCVLSSSSFDQSFPAGRSDIPLPTDVVGGYWRDLLARKRRR